VYSASLDLPTISMGHIVSSTQCLPWRAASAAPQLSCDSFTLESKAAHKLYLLEGVDTVGVSIIADFTSCCL